MTFFEILTWFLAAISLWGVWLNIRKDKRCFYLWIGANAGWIYIDVKANLIAQALLFCVYTVLSVYGLYIWGKEEKEKKRIEET